MTSLDQRLDADYATAWRPQPGEKIIGGITALDVREGAYGKYPIVTVQQDDGSELAVHAFHEVLANELAKLAPKIGDRIGVKYAGKHPDKGYHVYKVRRDGDDTEFAWSHFGGDTDSVSDVPSDFPTADTGYGQPPAQREDKGDDIPW